MDSSIKCKGRKLVRIEKVTMIKSMAHVSDNAGVDGVQRESHLSH